jgi:hypothetical protein
MNVKYCLICGGVLLSISMGMYECVKCGHHCIHEPHLQESHFTNFSQSGINVVISSGTTTASFMDGYDSLIS